MVGGHHDGHRGRISTEKRGVERAELTGVPWGMRRPGWAEPAVSAIYFLPPDKRLGAWKLWAPVLYFPNFAKMLNTQITRKNEFVAWGTVRQAA